MMQFDFTVTVLATDTVAVAELRETSLGILLAVGTAKCHPNDVPNKMIGINLAVGRALADYGLHTIEHAECDSHVKL